MKYRFLLSLALLISAAGFSQNAKRQIAFYSAFPYGQFSLPSMSDATTDIRHSYLLGADYSHPLNRWFSIAGGIEFSSHEVTYTSVLPMIPATTGTLQFISLPLYLRADISRVIFFTFGAIADIQTKNNITKPLNGWGITGGTGFKFDINKNTGVFIHPFYQLHTGHTNSPRVMNLGMRLGMAYRF